MRIQSAHSRGRSFLLAVGEKHLGSTFAQGNRHVKGGWLNDCRGTIAAQSGCDSREAARGTRARERYAHCRCRRSTPLSRRRLSLENPRLGNRPPTQRRRHRFALHFVRTGCSSTAIRFKMVPPIITRVRAFAHRVRFTAIQIEFIGCAGPILRPRLARRVLARRFVAIGMVRRTNGRPCPT
jgi:hypothetical protein